MYMHQKITTPALHGSAPRSLSMIINTPKAPIRRKNIKNFKEVYSLAKDNNDEYDKDEE